MTLASAEGSTGGRDGSPPGGASIPRLLVVGCGGIGGVLGGTLLAEGHDVTLLTTNRSIADAVNERGIEVRTAAGTQHVKAHAVVEPGSLPSFDWILLAVQPPQVEDAARAAAGVLAPDGTMVCLQNGLCESRVARIVGPERTAGAVVAWGASMLAPGVYERTSRGGFTIGRLPRPDEKNGGSFVPQPLEPLAAILSAVGRVKITDNLMGARWSKLAINCAVSSLGTIGGNRLGALLRRRRVRRLALEIMTEAVQVAAAEGVRLEPVAGTLDLDWLALTPAERTRGSVGLLAKHAALLAVGARYARLRSSMLSAIERGRPPAVDFLNGEVVEHATRCALSVPVNECVRHTVWKIARGEARPGGELLDELWQLTR